MVAQNLELEPQGQQEVVAALNSELEQQEFAALDPPTTRSKCKRRKLVDASKKGHNSGFKQVRRIISSAVNDVKKLKLQLRGFDKYNQLGTSRASAAADLLEFAVTTLGFYLRTTVADDILGKKVPRHELFGPGKIFWEGDIRDVNYTRTWWWMVNGTQNTLAQYWKKKGYTGVSLSTEWHAPPRAKGEVAGHENLKEYMKRADMMFSQVIGLTQSQVEFAIGLFLCGPKLQRNKNGHLFRLWKIVGGSKAATKKGCESGAFNLSQVEKSSLTPQLEDISIKELAARKWVLDDVLDNLGKLSPYYVQHAAEVKAIGGLLSKEIAKACGQTVWKIIANSATPDVGETNDIAGTYLRWDRNSGIMGGCCYCWLCKPHCSFITVAIDDKGCWWNVIEDKWVEFEVSLNDILV